MSRKEKTREGAVQGSWGQHRAARPPPVPGQEATCCSRQERIRLRMCPAGEGVWLWDSIYTPLYTLHTCTLTQAQQTDT